MNTESSDRLRVPPEQRFAGAEHAIDLALASAQLLREPAHPGLGHRQMTLYKHDATTIALFHFEAGGALPRHVAQGMVTIHVLDGHLQVATPSGERTLNADSILVFTPGVPHDVRAITAGRMLLTVCLVTAHPG